MYGEISSVNFEEIVNSKRLTFPKSLKLLCWLFVLIGTFVFVSGIIASDDPTLYWNSYYVSLVYFMGLSVGSVMITVIFQIVRATWVAPVRRLAEANIGFLPVAYILFLSTYAGKEHLFPWANAPRAGVEAWMNPDFVYIRFAIIFGLFFCLLAKFVSMSLYADIGVIRERSLKLNEKNHAVFSYYFGGIFDWLTKNWKGSKIEIPQIQKKLSILAPIVVLAYAITYTLFGFEMIMAMDSKWMSNLFGAFMFIGNIYIGWSALALTSIFYSSRNKDLAKISIKGTYWDLGKLNFGFCMLWGYFFFSQFLPQWYGNLPEETQWMILRTREYPWKGWGWVTFSLCFIIPFVLLLGRDLKKTKPAYALVALIVLTGVWCEKYLIITPNHYPTYIPFGIHDILIFAGFLGAYILSVQNFLTKVPCIPISHPQTYGNTEW